MLTSEGGPQPVLTGGGGGVTWLVLTALYAERLLHKVTVALVFGDCMPRKQTLWSSNCAKSGFYMRTTACLPRAVVCRITRSGGGGGGESGD